MKIPDTLAQTLAMIAELDKALGPPPELRAKTRVEIEIEAVGEGTFTIVVEPGALTAKKGFAKSPLVAIAISKGGWPLLQREIQAAVDGLPAAPALKQKLDQLRAPKPGELDLVIAALAKLQDACVRFQVKNGGEYAVARGPVDEATRVLTIGLDAADIDKVLAGAPPTTVKATTSGDRGVLTAGVAALGPVLNRLR